MKAWILKQLRQGLSPEKLAWCVALGLVIGVFPALGWTSLLCLMAATVGRLNQPTMQSVNYLVYPLQFILLIPFYKCGAWIFRAPPVTLTTGEIRSIIAAGIGHAIQVLWTLTWHGIVAWGVIGIPLTLLLVSAMKPIFRRMVR